MDDPLKRLVGLVVDQVVLVQDYIQLVFSDGSILSILNNYTCEGDSIRPLVGKMLESFRHDQEAIVFSFPGYGDFTVGMRSEDYSSPEAMRLSRPGEPLVVWN